MVLATLWTSRRDAPKLETCSGQLRRTIIPQPWDCSLTPWTRTQSKHLEVNTLWVQQLAKIDLISLNKLNTLENVADLLTKLVPRSKLAGTMGYTIPGEETQKFQEYENINQNYWDQ